MIFSYTQIAQYIRCPRRYRFKYLNGWLERENKASISFGRCFEKAIASYFHGDDCAHAFFSEWNGFRDVPLIYAENENWDKLYRQGIQLLEKFARENRVSVSAPEVNLQIRAVRKLTNGNEFVSFIDALGQLDGVDCVIDWKTTTRAYPEKPEGLLSLDPQLVCYSWMTGIRDVAFVVFVRKKTPHIQYLRTSIADRRWRDYEELVERSIAAIEGGEFPAHSGIRFPQDGCIGCSHLGICLDDQTLIKANLERKAGAQALDWIEQFVD